MAISIIKTAPVVTMKPGGNCSNCKYLKDGECIVAKMAETLCKNGQKK